MKREATDCPKLHDLADALEALGERHVFGLARGLLESLWHFTARHAPNGNVGRHSDRAIARACGWDGDPAGLIEALASTHWLDRHASLRLVVHDWPDHADDAVHSALARRRRYFFDGRRPSTRRLVNEERKDAERWYAEHPAPPRACRAHVEQTVEGSVEGLSRLDTLDGRDPGVASAVALPPPSLRQSQALPPPSHVPPRQSQALPPPSPAQPAARRGSTVSNAGTPAAARVEDRTVAHAPPDPEQPRAPDPAAWSDAELAELQARRAARWLLRQDGGGHLDPAAIADLTSRLTPASVEAALAEQAKHDEERKATAAKARSVEALRHEPAPGGRRRRA